METSAYEKESFSAVLRRDQGRCVVCGVSKCDVHEIVPRSALPGKNNAATLFSLENRCCVCRRCHDEVHTVWGRVMLLGIMRLKFGYRYNNTIFAKYFEVRAL